MSKALTSFILSIGLSEVIYFVECKINKTVRGTPLNLEFCTLQDSGYTPLFLQMRH